MATLTFDVNDSLGQVVGTLNDLSGITGDLSTLVEGQSNLTSSINAYYNQLTQFDDSSEQVVIFRKSLSVVDGGSFGSLAYNSNNGQITYTGQSVSEVRSALTATAGLRFDDGIMQLDSGNVTVTGFAGDAITSDLYDSVVSTRILNSAGQILVTLKTPGI